MKITQNENIPHAWNGEYEAKTESVITLLQFIFSCFIINEKRGSNKKFNPRNKRRMSMKKAPWHIFAWLCGEIVFFLTAAIIAVYLILNAIAGATSGSITLFTNWYQTLLFVADIVFIVATVGFAFLHFKKKAMLKAESGETKEATNA